MVLNKIDFSFSGNFFHPVAGLAVRASVRSRGRVHDAGILEEAIQRPTDSDLPIRPRDHPLRVH